jgi:hypothetical protein
MKLFKCQNCGEVLYFENRLCGSCGHALGFLPELVTLSALDAEGQALAAKGARYRPCANAAQDACNWMIAESSAEKFCVACRHNRTIPDVSQPEGLARWRKLELAKHRLFYTLLRLRLPMPNRVDDPEHGLVFDFLAETDGRKVLTGHDDGVITLNLAEADDAEREKMRVAMGEPYRTLIGHFRHEVGHYYWDVLVRDAGRLEECRAVFGDERESYADALKRHYAEGAPAGWQDHFISSYATTHPWEDFAETWAHYLHIVDTLEMAAAFGLRVEPKIAPSEEFTAELDFDPHHARDIDTLISAWLPLTFALNNLNRCMGEPDLYPFLLSPPAIAKLGYIQKLVRESA